MPPAADRYIFGPVSIDWWLLLVVGGVLAVAVVVWYLGTRVREERWRVWNFLIILLTAIVIGLSWLGWYFAGRT